MLADFASHFLILSSPSYFSSVVLNVSLSLWVRQGGCQPSRMELLNLTPERKVAASCKEDKDECEHTISQLGANIKKQLNLSEIYHFYTLKRFVD